MRALRCIEDEIVPRTDCRHLLRPSKRRPPCTQVATTGSGKAARLRSPEIHFPEVSWTVEIDSVSRTIGGARVLDGIGRTVVGPSSHASESNWLCHDPPSAEDGKSCGPSRPASQGVAGLPSGRGRPARPERLGPISTNVVVRAMASRRGSSTRKSRRLIRWRRAPRTRRASPPRARPSRRPHAIPRRGGPPLLPRAVTRDR
jgi:hypothetical protein